METAKEKKHKKRKGPKSKITIMLMALILVVITSTTVIITKKSNDIINSNKVTPEPFAFYSEDFSHSSPLVTSGQAGFQDGNILVVGAHHNFAGAVFSEKKLEEKEGFSTYFHLATDMHSTRQADGYCIILAKQSNRIDYTNLSGMNMGYGNIGPSIGIEIDMYWNEEDGGEADTPHMYLWVRQGNVEYNSAVHGEDGTIHLDDSILNGDFYVWIEYSNTTHIISIYVSKTETKPNAPTGTYNIDLGNVIGREYYIGISASTGDDYQNHWVKSWGYSNTSEFHKSANLAVNPNGGVWSGYTTTQNYTLNFDDTKQIPVPTRTGYTFAGWTLTGVGSKMSSLTSAATFTMGTADATLTANWTPIQYTVVYNGNGHTRGSTANSTHTYDVAKNLTKNGYERIYKLTYNYNGSGQSSNTVDAVATFNGWATSSTGGVTYRDQQSVINLRNTPGTYNVYANWTLAKKVLPSPTRRGHNLLGWSDNPNDKTAKYPAGSEYTPTRDTTLYAIWEPYTLKAKVNVKDNITKNIIESSSVVKVYEWSKSTGTYTEKMTLTRQSDKSYLTSNYLTYTDDNDGKFRIIEELAPYGYYGDYVDETQASKNRYDFNIVDIIDSGNYKGQSVRDKGTIVIDIENRRVEGKIELKKQDIESSMQRAQGDATVEGATYGLYAKENIMHPDGSGKLLYAKDILVDSKATDENGELVWEELYLGEYYVKELVPSNGYLIDENIYNVSIPYEGETKLIIEREVISKEQVKKQPFTFTKGIIKTNELLPGSSTSLVAVKDAGFSVYLISELSKVKDGTIRADVDGNYKIDEFIKEYFNNETLKYDFSGEQKAIVYNENDENGKLTLIEGNKYEVSELFSDKTGKVRSPELPYGKYLIIESTVPKVEESEYFIAEPIVVTIEEDSREEKLPDDNVFAVINYPFNAKIKITKVDSVTKKPILKVGTAYKIYNIDKNKYVTQTISYPEYMEIGTDENPYRVTEDGWLMTPEVLPVGNYRLEEVSAPYGYVLQGYEKIPREAVEFRIGRDSDYEVDEKDDKLYVVVKVKQEDDPQLGNLRIEKEGEKVVEKRKSRNFISRIVRRVMGEEEKITYEYEMKKVEGAEFEVYVKDTIYTPDNQKDEEGENIVNEYEGVKLVKDALVGRIRTDANGIATLEGLPLGKYYVKEVVAGEGYVINKEIKEVEFTYEGEKQAEVEREIKYVNERQKAEISVKKTVDTTGEALSGAEFGLYKKEGEEYILIEKQVTGEDGIIKFEADVPLGEYYVMEIEAPEDYIKSEVIKKIEFVYTDQEVAKQVFTEEFDNEIARTPLKYVDTGDGNEVTPGEILTYTITYRNEKNINEKVKIEDKIPEGTRYVKGYATAEVRGKGEAQGLILKEPTGEKDGEYIEWESDTFELKPGETLRVTFKVRVKMISEGLEVDKVSNKATITHGENINIYVKKVKYKVKYYKDNIVNGEFLGEEEFEGNLGEEVKWDRIDKNLLKPEGYKDGEIAEESAKELGRGENVIYVVYKKEKEEPEPENKKPFITKYYKDSISEENKLGEKELEGEIGDKIDWDKINKNLLKPTGYKDGEIEEGISAKVIEENGENIVYIVYKKEETKKGVVVKYYKDNIVTGEYLGDDYIEIGENGEIDLDKVDKNKYRPEEYKEGKIDEDASGNLVIYVVYEKEKEEEPEPENKKPFITKYYKDSISEENELGEKEVEGEIGEKIDWDKINKDIFKPEGYESGEIDEEISATIIEEDGENIVYIVYKKKENKEPEKITVKYYKEKIEEGLFLGEEKIEAEVGDIINYDLIDTEKKRVEGYSIGIIIEEISAKVVEEGKENIVYVVYMKLPEKDETNEVESPIKPYSKEISVGKNVAVMAGEEVEYTVAYKNTSKVEEEVKITDKIPEGTKYVKGSATAKINKIDAVSNGRVKITEKEEELVWETQEGNKLKPNEQIIVTFKVKIKTIDEGLNVDKIKNKAKIEHNGKEEETEEIENKVSNPSKEVDVGDGEEVTVGSTLTYKLKYKNTTEEEEKVVITDKIPKGTGYVKGSMKAKVNGEEVEGIEIKEVEEGERGEISWSIENLKVGEIIEVEFKVKVNEKKDKVKNVGEVEHEGKISKKPIKEKTNEIENKVVEPPFELPDTGDPNTSDINIWLYIVIVFIAIIGIVISIRIINKKKNKSNK